MSIIVLSVVLVIIFIVVCCRGTRSEYKSAVVNYYITVLALQIELFFGSVMKWEHWLMH